MSISKVEDIFSEIRLCRANLYQNMLIDHNYRYREDVIMLIHHQLVQLILCSEEVDLLIKRNLFYESDTILGFKFKAVDFIPEDNIVFINKDFKTVGKITNININTKEDVMINQIIFNNETLEHFEVVGREGMLYEIENEEGRKYPVTTDIILHNYTQTDCYTVKSVQETLASVETTEEVVKEEPYAVL